ncbi:MAG: type IX secretion system PorP/SprF family membrane protein [Crocinitomicaceae bacterium]|jgi:type IX secretion system PorP/SprF family membrane protein
MKRRLLVLSLIACTVGVNANAQQDRAMTHFMYEKMSVNPGATGINFLDGFCGTSIYRNQWDKVNGAPNSVVLNVEGNIDRYMTNTGVGIAFYHDAIAYTRQNTAVINFAHHFQLGGIGQLGVGVGIGITSLGMNPEWVPPTSNPDISLPEAFSQTKFDANFGLYFKANAGYYIGLSSTHIPGPTFDDATLTAPTGLNSARHYYLMGGHTIRDITQRGDDLEMNLFVRSDLVKTSFDLNARYFWQNKLYGGLTYRMSDAIGIMAGANVSELLSWPGTDLATRSVRPAQFTVGYSYDVSVHRLSSISTGSHEMFVKYCYFLPPIPISKSKHPRWL